MKSQPKLKLSSRRIIKLSWLLAVLFLFVCSSAHCLAAEKTYLITESQLTQLEMNLSELKQQNSKLQEQLKQSKVQVQTLQEQSKQLQTQMQDLNNSLTSAKALLKKYETSRQDKKYAVGLGVSNNNIALNADYKKMWLYFDKETAAIGYKFEF